MKFMRYAACILLLTAVLAGICLSVSAEECSACNGGSATAQQDVLNNEWAAFLGKENASTVVMSSANGLVTPQYSRQNNQLLQRNKGKDPSIKENLKVLSLTQGERSDSFASVLVPLDGVNDSDIILDISPNSTEYIPGAISIPYTKFLGPESKLKSVSEMAAILSDAGISQDDSVLIYGECQPCGGGPSAATYIYWIMKYLGHQNVRLLDGGIDDWVAAGQPTVSEPVALPAQRYSPAINPDLLATYEFVNSGEPQIIDARSATEFEAGSIPGSMNIPYERILDEKKIKDEAALEELFSSSLGKDRPVVVYTNTGVKASMTWLALNLLGYDARIYTWQDWQAKLPHLNLKLKEASAKPNPAEIGDRVQITAVFEKKNQSSNETILTIKGCATCGFGSPQGYADLSSTDGIVRIGSDTRSKKSGEGSFSVSATVKSPSGDTVSRVVMTRIKSTGDEFAGIWNANVASGTYSVDIVAALGDLSATFPDVLEIEVGRHQ